MSKYKLEEVTYSMDGYSPSFKIIDNDVEIEDIEKEDGSIAYLHGIDEDTAKSIVGILERETNILNSLERQIAKKPISHGREYTDQWLCPTCNRLYWEREFLSNYCDSCGQKLDLDQ